VNSQFRPSKSAPRLPAASRREVSPARIATAHRRLRLLARMLSAAGQPMLAVSAEHIADLLSDPEAEILSRRPSADVISIDWRRP